MQHSLLSRFHGGLFGSLLGETLSRNAVRAEKTAELDLKFSFWSNIGIELSDRLLATGILSTNDWEQIYRCHQNDLGAKIPPHNDDIALAVLPLLFFFHDNFALLREQLQPLCDVWQLSAEGLEELCILGCALALALKEKLDGEKAIAQILERYQGLDTPLIRQLEQFQTFLLKKASLEEIILETNRQDNLKNSGIAMAFYCFSYTPEDLQLSLMRATKTPKQTIAIAALTGALAGAYNGFNGIPVAWRVAIKRNSTGQRQARQIAKLFALWSGTYQCDRPEVLQSMAIASPAVIQPRPALKIISQGEYPLTKSSHKVNSNVINKVNDLN